MIPYETANESTAVAVVSDNWLSAQTIRGLSEKQRKQHNALVATELFKLRIAYPTQARNFSDAEVQATNTLWSEIFAGVDPQILHEAIRRFIITDRKGFFPAPGQIVAFVEQISGELKEREWKEAAGRHYQEMQKHFALVEQGEHCGNCAFVRRENCARGMAFDERIFCTNPEAIYYEGDGDWKCGTACSKRCELFQYAKALEACDEKEDT